MTQTQLRCRTARLDWSQPGGPRAADFGDVYYSVEDGLEETRAVFLEACDLPSAWQGRRNYVVGELGFGTGLNALALWQLWREHRPSEGWLHFLSVEKHPLTREDAARALADWPQLQPLIGQLLAQWPSALKGAHRLVFAEDRFSITIFHGEAEAALEEIEGEVDCWFLDGFAPAKNDAMWSQAVLDRIGRLSAPGARIGTFTVAGAVRRGLQAAGFEVEKRPGFGRKRERLQAIYAGQARQDEVSPFARADRVGGRVAVIGAGIAGASLAHALRIRGRDVVLVDPLDLAGGASGAPAGLLTPRLERADRPHVRATLAAWEFARRLYGGCEAFRPSGVVRTAKDASEAERLFELADLMGEGFEMRGQGVLMHDAGWFDPAGLVRDLAGDTPVIRREVARIDEGPDGLTLHSAAGQPILEADAIIHASGYGAGMVLPEITPSAGLLAVLDGTPPERPLVWGGYAVPSPGGGVVLGATHRKGLDAGPADEAVAGFREALAAQDKMLADALESQTRSVWTGVRASTPDRLPVCGNLPGESFDETWSGMARGRTGSRPGPGVRDRQFILSGLGSRGFAHAPLLAEELVSQLCGEPGALERSARQSLHPARFAWRRLKRS